jgi:hypothetical protein
MTHLPVSRDLQPSPQARAARPASTTRDRSTVVINSSDLPIIIAVCLAGLLLTLNFMMRYPDVGELIQQYNLF